MKKNYSGTILNQRYQIIKNLGQDESGLLFIAQDLIGKKQVLLKLISFDQNKFTPRQFYLIQLDAQKKSAFHHSNLIPFCPPELTEEGLLLSQMVLPGESLSQLLARKGHPLPYSEAIQIADDLTSVLASLHSSGIVYGKISPSTILINNEGRAFLSFLPLPDQFGKGETYCQDPAFSLNSGINPAEDIFSLGIILSLIFTNIIPLQNAEKSPSQPSAANPADNIYQYYQIALKNNFGPDSEKILQIIRKCLNANPAARYPTGVDLYWAFHNTLETQEKPQNPGNSPAGNKDNPFERTIKQTAKEDNSEKNSAKKRTSRKFTALLLSAIGILLLAGIGMSIRFSQKIKGPSALPDFSSTLNVLYITQTALDSLSQVSPSPTETAVPPTETPAAAETALTPTAVPQFTHEIGSRIQWKKDHMEMVYVPEGKFIMGADHTFLFTVNNILPANQVLLDSFWIDQTEVTQDMYALCVKDGKCQEITTTSPENKNQAISNATWEDAYNYCSWAGKRLLTEAEWEKAARGTDGRFYPWGNDTPQITNASNEQLADIVQKKDISPYGVLSMAGGVSEWINDYFSETRLIVANSRNPLGPLEGTQRTIKGGSTQEGNPEVNAYVFRRSGSDPKASANFGFRCAAADNQVSDDTAVPENKTNALAPALTYESNPADCTNIAGFVADVTIPDGTEVTSGQWITKTWTLKNIGTCVMNPNYKIVWNDPDLQNIQQTFDIGKTIKPGDQADVSISFQAQGSGTTKIGFILADSNGQTFGLGERGRGGLWIQYNITDK